LQLRNLMIVSGIHSVKAADRFCVAVPLQLVARR
jgi:hypothetical protein